MELWRQNLLVAAPSVLWGCSAAYVSSQPAVALLLRVRCRTYYRIWLLVALPAAAGQTRISLLRTLHRTGHLVHSQTHSLGNACRLFTPLGSSRQGKNLRPYRQAALFRPYANAPMIWCTSVGASIGRHLRSLEDTQEEGATPKLTPPIWTPMTHSEALSQCVSVEHADRHCHAVDTCSLMESPLKVNALPREEVCGPFCGLYRKHKGIRRNDQDCP